MVQGSDVFDRAAGTTLPYIFFTTDWAMQAAIVRRVAKEELAKCDLVRRHVVALHRLDVFNIDPERLRCSVELELKLFRGELIEFEFALNFGDYPGPGSGAVWPSVQELPATLYGDEPEGQ